MLTPYMKQRQEMKNKGAKPAEPKKRAPIAKVSAKRKELNKEYSKTTKPLWQGKTCRVNAPGCTIQAQGMHHLEGKENAEKLLNTKKQIPACNHCNTYIEDNHAWAVEHGFKLKKNTATNRYDNTYKKP